jgi:hypothetical protein
VQLEIQVLLVQQVQQEQIVQFQDQQVQLVLQALLHKLLLELILQLALRVELVLLPLTQVVAVVVAQEIQTKQFYQLRYLDRIINGNI